MVGAHAAPVRVVARDAEGRSRAARDVSRSSTTRATSRTRARSCGIGFNDAVVDMTDLEKAKKKAPSIVITPSVPGHTVWTYASEVEFRAEKPFDPDTEYTLEIPELTSPAGKKLEGGFKATFKADPIVEVAGKTIYYVPKPGRARPIAMSPSDDSMLGGPQAVTIVYDQPIDLGLAAKLVTITKHAPDAKDGKKQRPDQGPLGAEPSRPPRVRGPEDRSALRAGPAAGARS